MCIPSDVEIYSIGGQNIFNPMTIYSISMVTSSKRYVAVRNRKRSPTSATEERRCSPGTYEALKKCGDTLIEGNVGRVSGKLDWALRLGVKHLKKRQSMLHDQNDKACCMIKTTEHVAWL